jgi:hypothetical protein
MNQLPLKKKVAEEGTLKPRTRKPAVRIAPPVAGMVQRTIYARDIAGIMYYIDADGNVYKHEDVLANKPDPQIIGVATTGDTGKFRITFCENPGVGPPV